MNEAIEFGNIKPLYDYKEMIDLALATWYPKNHHLHLDPIHPAMGLVGEVGEWINKHKKDKYKAGFIFSREDELDELGDIWYYLRILMHQFEILPMEPDRLRETLGEYMATLSIKSAAVLMDVHQNDIRTDKYDHFYLFESIQNHILKLYDYLSSYLVIYKNTSLDELTTLNWEKLKPGSKRGDEWTSSWEEGC